MKSWLKREAIFLIFAAVTLLICGALIYLNHVQTHYHGITYQLRQLAYFLPWGVALFFLAKYLERISSYFAFVLETVARFYWVFFLASITCYAVQFTPFHLIDASLNHLDNLVGFSSAAVFEYTKHHQWLFNISSFAYKSLSQELIIIPFLLAFLSEKRSVRLFFLANLMGFLLSSMIYYFFPTTEPASVVHGVNFLREQYYVIAQWYEIHHHVTNYIHFGALVGFPSLHVVWSILLVYACRNRKWLFYPLMVFNTIIIMSTMTLGWHFLTDVVGGFVVAFAVIAVAEKCLPKEVRSKKVYQSLRLVTARQFCQRFNCQTLNNNSKNYYTVSHRKN